MNRHQCAWVPNGGARCKTTGRSYEEIAPLEIKLGNGFIVVYLCRNHYPEE